MFIIQVTICLLAVIACALAAPAPEPVPEPTPDTVVRYQSNNWQQYSMFIVHSFNKKNSINSILYSHRSMELW